MCSRFSSSYSYVMYYVRPRQLEFREPYYESNGNRMSEFLNGTSSVCFKLMSTICYKSPKVLYYRVFITKEIFKV